MNPSGARLTKLRFVLACGCPRKLYYANHPERYANARTEDSFLEALAEGGYQVGALARMYSPGGIEIEEQDPDAAVARTSELLQSRDVTLFEAAFQHGNIVVRVDVLEKRGDVVSLVEVKAKSDIDPKYGFRTNEGELRSDWVEKLMDVAFQTWVVRAIHPNWKVTPFLCLADKQAIATVDGLHQRFRIERHGRKHRVVVAPATRAEDLGAPLLVRRDVTAEVEKVLKANIGDKQFEEAVRTFEDAIVHDVKLDAKVGSRCKHCEFRVARDELPPGLESGFDECWRTEKGLDAERLASPMVFDVWNFHSGGAIARGKYLARDLDEHDLKVKPPDGKPGLNPSQRQWLQVVKVRTADATPYVSRDELRSAMREWRYPFHLIDFETSMVAIPFQRGRRPYEQIAFQFSHHVMHENGRVEHKDQYLSRETGVFPNFAFVRELRAALDTDEGSIFRYALHERTVLHTITKQLERSDEPDRAELIAWIHHVTDGERAMVDMLDVVKRYYYHPRTGGSNSIKDVLPAVLAHSDRLRETYARPIYGTSSGVRSLNYRDWTWVRFDDRGEPLDPYHLLPPVFDDYSRETLDRMFQVEQIRDGGAALTAYARMQFTEMSDAERDRVCAALLKYCELDTFAMVMLIEAWQAMV